MHYLVVHKKSLIIFDSLSIPIPMSHGMESKAEALRWMTQRGMQAECTIMPMSKFRALSGLPPLQANVLKKEL